LGLKKLELHERFYYFKKNSSIIDPMGLCFKRDIEIIIFKKRAFFALFVRLKLIIT